MSGVILPSALREQAFLSCAKAVLKAAGTKGLPDLERVVTRCSLQAISTMSAFHSHDTTFSKTRFLAVVIPAHMTTAARALAMSSAASCPAQPSW